MSWHNLTEHLHSLNMPDIDDVIDLVNFVIGRVSFISDAIGGLVSGIPGLNTILGAVNSIQGSVITVISLTSIFYNQTIDLLNTKFAEVLDSISDITNFITDILDVITDIPSWMISFVTNLMLSIKTVIELATRIFTTNIAKLTDMAISTTIGMTAIVQSLIQAAITDLGNSLIVLKGVLDTVMLQLTDVLKLLVQDVINVMNLITKIIIENTNKVLSAGRDAAIRVYKGVASARITALAATVATGFTYRLALTQ